MIQEAAQTGAKLAQKAAQGEPYWIAIGSLTVALLAVVVGPAIQLRITSRRIRAESRRDWMNELRETISNFLSNVRSILELYNQGQGQTQDCRVRVEQARTNLDRARLLLDPSTDNHVELDQKLTELFDDIEQPPAPDDFVERRASIVSLSRTLLDEAWTKVKEGDSVVAAFKFWRD